MGMLCCMPGILKSEAYQPLRHKPCAWKAYVRLTFSDQNPLTRTMMNFRQSGTPDPATLSVNPTAQVLRSSPVHPANPL